MFVIVSRAASSPPLWFRGRLSDTAMPAGRPRRLTDASNFVTRAAAEHAAAEADAREEATVEAVEEAEADSGMPEGEPGLRLLGAGRGDEPVF
ncbi:hypothetical protein [Streptomyces mexicanus]|uniref:hypothetical protein n=1 Tax=Streptomyces mexicanus TaxID=178566 RepID=UPI003657D374